MWLAPERHRRRRWFVPALALLTGVGVAITLAVRDDAVRTGLIAGGVLAGYALQLAYRRDEPGLVLSESFGRGRQGRGHLRAAAMTGDILVGGLVVTIVVQALRGAELGPLPWLAALAGVTYAVSILITGAD